MTLVEVDGTRLDLPGRSRSVSELLERAVSTYLDQTRQPNHAEVASHRVDGWGRQFRRYDVFAETDSENGGRRRHRYFDVTVFN